MANSASGAGYLVTIRDVREVTLAGAADASFWRDHLAELRLYPTLVDGRAQLAIGGTALRWLGLPFRELTVSAAVSTRPDGSSDGWFLAAAFNSSPVLAAMERGLFKTPYVHGALRLTAGERAGFELRDTRGIRLAAHMGSRVLPVQNQDSWWEGSIFLPRTAGDGTTSGRAFRVKLGGATAVRGWDAAGDVFTVAHTHDSLERSLLESHFEPLEWRIRDAAVHARSKTVRRA